MTGAAGVVLLALAFDAALGDPPNRLHPVAWVGAVLAAGRRRLARGSPHQLLMAGGTLVVAVALVAAAGGWAIARLGAEIGAPGIVLEAIALKLMLAVRGLVAAGARVAGHLARDDLVAARAAVGTDLVSRPTATLDSPAVASAAIESVAENVTDSVVAPLLFYAAFGLPGAFAYRVVNTADAMLGYRDGALEYFGKVAARLDDALNFVPARFAALVVLAGAAVTGAGGGSALTVLWREHARTASPNAGWTMAAMAGALGVRLEKTGHYRLGAGRPPSVGDVRRSLRVVAAAAAITGLAVAAMLTVASAVAAR